METHTSKSVGTAFQFSLLCAELVNWLSSKWVLHRK